MGAVESAARVKRVEVVAELPSVPVLVFGDAVRLRQIAWHLLANAIKFTPRGGTVRWRVDIPLAGPARRQGHRTRDCDPSSCRASSIASPSGCLADSLRRRPRHGPVARARARRAARRADPRGKSRSRGSHPDSGIPSSAAERHAGPADPAAEDGSWGAPLDGIRVLVFEPDMEGRQVFRQL